MTAPPLGSSLQTMLRPHLSDAIEEIEREVRVHVLDCVPITDVEYGRVIRQTITDTVAYFVDSLGPDEPDPAVLRRLYTRLGAEEARRGRSLDQIQTALRVSSQVACRRIIKDAYRFSLPKETLASLTDNLFEIVARAADAAAQGYAREQGHMATDRERRRTRLRELLTREPPPTRDVITDQARAADWQIPDTVTVVVLLPATRPPSRILPPDVLPNWDAPAPYLIVPDPDSPGREELLDLLTPVGAAAIGPTVPLTRAATSLRWARRTIILVERGILPAHRPVRSSDHTALLAASMAEDLIDATSATSLAPLLALPARRRTVLLSTLLAYLQCGDNAAVAGERLQVHEQTVRYRLRRIAELTGKPSTEPAERLDVMIALTWFLHIDRTRMAESGGPLPEYPALDSVRGRHASPLPE